MATTECVCEREREDSEVETSEKNKTRGVKEKAFSDSF